MYSSATKGGAITAGLIGAGASTGTLPRTGFSIAAFVIVALVIISLGFVLLRVAARRAGRGAS